MTEYKITQGKVIESRMGVSQSFSESGSSGSLKEMYYPDVTYSYMVDGETYENNQFWDEEIKLAQEQLIRPYVEEHPVGKSVTVYYDPFRPDNAYLQKLPNFNAPDIQRVIIAAAIAIGLLVMALGAVAGALLGQ